MDEKEKVAEGVETAARTPAQTAQEELNNRVNGFVTDYQALVEKYKVDFAQYPVYVPNGQGGFTTTIQNTPVDVSNQPVKSPIVVTE